MIIGALIEKESIWRNKKVTQILQQPMENNLHQITFTYGKNNIIANNTKQNITEDIVILTNLSNSL